MSDITPYPHRRLITQAVQKRSPPELHHTFWIQAAFSNNCLPNKNSVFPLVSLLLIHIFSSSPLLFLSHLSPWILPYSSPVFPLLTPCLIPFTHTTVGSTQQCCLRKEPAVGQQAEMLLDPCFLPPSGKTGAHLDQQEAGQGNSSSSNAGSIRQG